MSDVYLFQLATQRTSYLSARQTLIAGNVANANTPAYKAMDLAPFSSVLDKTSVRMSSTDPAHLTPTAQEIDPARPRDDDASDYQAVSGNSVELENEMVKLGEVNRDFAMATDIKKTFHQMFMQALK